MRVGFEAYALGATLALALASSARGAAAASDPAATTAAPPSTSPPSGGFLLDRATTWDLAVDGAVGRWWSWGAARSDRWMPMARARVGVLFVRDPVFDAVDLSVELSPLAVATFGLSVEALRIDSGLWGRLGALVDVTGRPGVTLAGGWSVFGLELETRAERGAGWGTALLAEVSVPIGLIVHEVVHRAARPGAAPAVSP